MTKSQSLILNLILNWHFIFKSFMVHSKSPMSMASKPPEKTRRWERCKWTAKGAKGESRWAYRTKSRHENPVNRSESQRKHDKVWHVWLNMITWLNIFYHFDVKFDFPKVWFLQGSVLRRIMDSGSLFRDPWPASLVACWNGWAPSHNKGAQQTSQGGHRPNVLWPLWGKALLIRLWRKIRRRRPWRPEVEMMQMRQIHWVARRWFPMMG